MSRSVTRWPRKASIHFLEEIFSIDLRTGKIAQALQEVPPRSGRQGLLPQPRRTRRGDGRRAGRADAGFELGGGFRRGADESEQWPEAETGGRRNRGPELKA